MNPQQPILDNHYRLLIDDHIVDEATWHALVQPGCTINMRLESQSEFRKSLTEDLAFQASETQKVEKEVGKEGSAKRSRNSSATEPPKVKKPRLAQLPEFAEVNRQTEDVYKSPIREPPQQQDKATAERLDSAEVFQATKARKSLPSAIQVLQPRSPGRRRPAERYSGQSLRS